MKKRWLAFCMIMMVAILLLPIGMVIMGAFMSGTQLNADLGPMLQLSKGYSTWSIIPDFTLHHMIELLFDTPEFYIMFWNSVKITVVPVFGQILVGIPAAWVFARYDFKGKTFIFQSYLILLVMPFIVLMLPQYLVMQKFNLLDTHWAIILPGIFSAMPVIFAYPYFKSIPEILPEAARMEGYNDLQIFFRIALPLAKPAVVTSCFFNFIEYWGILEQALIFLKDKSKWNLSLFITSINKNNIGIAFASALISMIPVLMFFFQGNVLEEGLADMTLKE